MKKIILLLSSKKVLLIFVLIYFISAGASYFYFSRDIFKKDEEINDTENKSLKSAFDLSPIPTPAEPTTYNILLLGHGGAGHSGGALADSMMVVHVNPELKISALISVPRDTWITLPKDSGKVNKKLNHAYAVGGGELAKKAVSTVVGLPIQYYMGVSFDGLEAAINTLDGVEVDVPKTFDDYWYPVRGRELEACGMTAEEIGAITATMSGFAGEKMFPCRYEHIHHDKGIEEMDGATALKFVRSRHSVQHGGDFARSQRQFALLVGIKNKLLDLGAMDDYISFFQKLSQMVQTDVDERVVQLIMEMAGDVTTYSIKKIQLTEENVLEASRSYDGQFILLPKEGIGEWGNVHKFIQNELARE